MARMPDTIHFESNRAAVEMRIASEAKSRVERAAELVRGEAMNLMSGPKRGRRYKVPGTKGAWYTASAPGEAPAVPTGRLKGSIVREVRVTESETVALVGTALRYGAELEFGNRRVQPRPWLLPAFNNMRDQIYQIIGGRWW